MSGLRFTLLADGSSDQVLVPILRWLLARHGIEESIDSWADLGRLPHPPRKLSDRIRVAIDLYPCDLLFIHRDAERMRLESRKNEIQAALQDVAESRPPAVCIIPVRMQEAWLLIEEAAIRHAAGNRDGQEPLSMPKTGELERIVDPKTLLHDLLRQASGLHGHRLRKFSAREVAGLVSELIRDFSPLLRLRAFQELDTDLATTVPALASREGSRPYINGS
jgi:hypothetical protein